MVMLMFAIWVFYLMSAIFGSDQGNINLDGEMDVYHRVTYAVILLLGLIFTLLVYPICNYLEKKLKD